MKYQIPLFNLNFDEAENHAALDVLDSKWISAGPKCIELEKKFAEMMGVKYALVVSNCTAALHLAALSLNITSGDEVIVPSLTFVATINSIRYTGAKPVFCDIAAIDNLCIDSSKIESLITEKTKAISIMHFGGFACDIDNIVAIARKYNLRIIEDACHAPMSEYEGKKLGSIGDVGCFSFFSNKNISTGEGGILVTNDETIYKKAKLMRSHGMTTMSYERSKGHSTEYDVILLGYNYRFNDILAGIGIAQLDKLIVDIEKRRSIRERYIAQLGNEKRIVVPFKEYSEFASSYIFPVVLAEGNKEDRDHLRQYLADNGVQTSVHYPPAHKFKIYQDYVKEDLPITEYVGEHEITLPMYGALKNEEIDYICDTVKNGLSKIFNGK